MKKKSSRGAEEQRSRGAKEQGGRGAARKPKSQVGVIGTPEAVRKPEPKPEPKSKKVERLLKKSVQMYLTKMPVWKGKKLIGAGKLISLDLDETGKMQLIGMGAVRAVMSPPLRELAGWQTRAKRLEPLGVVTMADFLTVGAADLAKALRVKEETALDWQGQLRTWSEAETPPRR